MLFIALGLAVGGLGTLIGVGGGFLLVPILLYLHPEMSAAQVTAISLFCVTLNAFSGASQYAIQKQIHYKSGIIFAMASLPGAWMGVGLTKLVPRENFELFYGGLLLIMGGYLLLKKKRVATTGAHRDLFLTKKEYAVGTTSSFGVGFIASFFGVGGGIIHVPLLSQVLRFPVRSATATSQFILAITSLAAVIQHYIKGSLSISEPFVAYLGVGMILGAQIGGRLSKKINAEIILRVLAVTIVFVAIRTFYLYFR